MQILKRIPYLASLALLVYMPFHIFLSQWLSLATGGLDFWKAGKDGLLIIVVVFTICLVYAQGKGSRTFNWLLGVTVLYGVLHMSLWVIHPDIYDRSAMIGTMYNMRLPLFAILGFGAVLLVPKFVFSSVIKVMLITSSIVATVGIVQFFLPDDILTHVGYSLDRGARPVFYIEDNRDLPHRIMSTLREPNALGAFLILPITVLATLGLRAKDRKRKYLYVLAAALHLAALLLTFSRSAWLGAALALMLAGWWHFRERASDVLRRLWPVAVGAAVAFSLVAYTVRNTSFFQQYVIHSNPAEQVSDLDSNDYHTLLTRQGLEGIANEPLGHGPGTAGLASIQNPKGGQLTENYYVQIGYEIGLPGIVLFLVLNIWMYVRIWKRHDYIAIALCAGFWAYVLTNMLLHTWSNEAVAAQWWILAGMALAMASPAKPHEVAR
ncbi:MAG: O-antigen ligase family protein [Patescibacteria group bacterium]